MGKRLWVKRILTGAIGVTTQLYYVIDKANESSAYMIMLYMVPVCLQLILLPWLQISHSRYTRRQVFATTTTLFQVFYLTVGVITITTDYSEDTQLVDAVKIIVPTVLVVRTMNTVIRSFFRTEKTILDGRAKQVSCPVKVFVAVVSLSGVSLCDLRNSWVIIT